MTRSLTATKEVRLRPALVAALITLTFITGIGAGLGLARVTAGPVAHQAAIGVLAGSGTDMSAAAYEALRQAPAKTSPAYATGGLGFIRR